MGKDLWLKLIPKYFINLYPMSLPFLNFRVFHSVGIKMLLVLIKRAYKSRLSPTVEKSLDDDDDDVGWKAGIVTACSCQHFC